MSSRRKKYDGDLPGGSTGIAERRNPLGNESKTAKYAPPKRPTRNTKLSDSGQLDHGEEDSKDRYLITYADLITLLLGLFIILYAISNIDAKKYEKMISAMGSVFGNEGKISGLESKDINSRDLPAGNLKNELSELINDYNYDQSIRLEENERGITIHIMDEILFRSGSSDLNKSSLTILSKISSILKELPNDIRVEGHTDNVPINSASFPSNWHLSVSRALNTAYYLINNEQLPPDKITIVGHSEYMPIATNETPEGRANNRRVDIVITKK